ncbi:MAG: site-specific tyrosine recombinase XerD [Bacteroidia bacterium]|nr:site-specific tyrosine recombinase XerD [Bacteroidia bacterium]
MKWELAIQDFQHYLRIERGLAEHSISNYSRDVKKLSLFLEEKQVHGSPAGVGKEMMEQFIYEMAKKLNPRSQARLISGLKSFFEYLVFEGYRKENPMVLIESPKLGRKLPDTLSVQEIDQLISAIDLSKPEGERNRAILETLYGCGLRVSELTGLKLSDLYFDEQFIKVTGKGNKQRFVPVAKHTKKYIELYLNEVRQHMSAQRGQEDYLFLNRRGRQLSRAMIFTIVKRLSEKTGLQKKISPHTFRHSFATHLLKNGADIRAIQQMLGHESITTTEIYMHVDRSHLQGVLEKFHPRN